MFLLAFNILVGNANSGNLISIFVIFVSSTLLISYLYSDITFDFIYSKIALFTFLSKVSILNQSG